MEGNLEQNACRSIVIEQNGNVWGNNKPFCFVNASLSMNQSLWKWENCDIPECGKDCFRPGVDADDGKGIPECISFK